jgi:nucleoid DNA-binding protein
VPIPKNPNKTYESKRSPNRKHSRVEFAQLLNKNIAKYSKFVMKPGGNVAIAVVNYDFCYEIVELFMETLTQFLLKKGVAFFDQFGKFEIRSQKARTLNSPVTNGIMHLPEIKMIKFVPSKRLKDRIRGTVKGRIRRRFASSSSEIIYADEELEDETLDEKNIVECEED